ncbi:hypothetical protein KI688_012660 [Linnemannia hyalina]|uniref:Uncharacterized protein n=1 Tax=Linnemannia hyalina TaxID=64524 RepID=A0A9P7XSW7_9FUNG|nr:hypothetical protein KI688_012660 [Linnemannia hyalina]
MTNNTMRITYRGATTCYLAVDTIYSCGCPTCSFFTQFESYRFKDDKDCSYAVIAMDEFEKVLDFQICPSHQMRMNLVPWKDREEARSADMDLMIHGGQRDSKCVDSVIIDGAICQLAVEILQPPPPMSQEQCYQQQQLYYQQYIQTNPMAL